MSIESMEQKNEELLNKHKETYTHSEKAVDLEYLKIISNTEDSKKYLNILIESCKKYYETVHELEVYILNNQSEFNYDQKVAELAEVQSDYHDIVISNLEEYILELEEENIDTSWSNKIRDDRREIGRFAVLTGMIEL